MQFSSALLLAAAFTAANAAKFTMGPAFFQGIKAGVPLNITWSFDAAGPVTILLKNGIATNLKTVAGAPTASSAGTSTTYTIPTTLQDGEYAFEIDEGSLINYSVVFAVTGGTASASTTAPSSSASSTSGSSSLITVTSNSTSTATSSGASATGNSTKTTATSATKTPTGTSTGATATPTNNNSGASGVVASSPLAFVFLALAAIMTLQ